MNSELLDSVYNLKEILETNEDIVLLNELEAKMLSNDEFKTLSLEKEKLSASINKDNIDKVVMEEIDKITAKMRSLPVTKEYLAQYNKVTHIYDKINKEIFYPFTNKTSLRDLFYND